MVIKLPRPAQRLRFILINEKRNLSRARNTTVDIRKILALFLIKTSLEFNNSIKKLLFRLTLPPFYEEIEEYINFLGGGAL